jgi:ribosomal protein S18 acetylase RimI-like enzyme
MPTLEVRPATMEDEKKVIHVITLAFSTDPVVRWALPDPTTYLSVMPGLAQAFGGNGFAPGTVDMVEGGTAAAMWLPPGVHPDYERMTAITEQHVPADRLDDMNRVFEQMATYHPQESCWYLPLIGVDPLLQGRGLGSALLRYATMRCDADGVLAYLESSNPRNIPLYERHGFEAMGSIQSGSSPTMVPMLRRPLTV